MKFKLGDFVRFVDEKREGYVTRVIDANTLGVTDTDGFEIPVQVGNLTHVHGQFTKEREDDITLTKTIPNAGFPDPGFFLFLAQDKKANGVVHFHLVNNTQNIALSTFTSLKNNQYKGEFHGIIAPNAAVKIFSAGLPDLSNWPELSLQALLFSTNQAPQKPVIFTKKFKAKDFEPKKINLSGIDNLGWKFNLKEEELVIDPIKLKESFYSQEETKVTIPKPNTEVDLHIEVLRDDYQFMQNSEILNIQMTCFEKNIDAALVHRMPSIIFVHGVGNGVLQNQIHKYLGKHQQVRTFKDAQKEKFGYGATEVFFK